MVMFHSYVCLRKNGYDIILYSIEYVYHIMIITSILVESSNGTYRCGVVLEMRDLQITMVAGFNAKSWSVEDLRWSFYCFLIEFN